MSAGSNMNSAVLGARRQVYPAESCPCYVPGWYLNFNVEGVPYFEPCFASIGRSPWRGTPDRSMQLQAVAHRITADDFVRIQRTEGGGGHAGLGYEAMKINAVFYDGRKVETVTLLHTPKAVAFYANPSKRYFDLIVNGAKESGLSPEYISYLESNPVYQRPQSWASRAVVLSCTGPFFLLAVCPVLLCFFLSKFLCPGGTQQPPRALFVALDKLMNACYILHNRIWVRFAANGYYNKAPAAPNFQ